MQTKVAMVEKKQPDNVARWEEIQEDEKRKITFEVRRILLEENMMMADITTEKNRVMMMEPRVECTRW